MSNERHGKWEIIPGPVRLPKSDPKHPYVLARCECGTIARVHLKHVEHGRSIGCRKCQKRGTGSLYNVWVQMRQRCTNPRNKDYKSYGAKGVSVAPEWDSFERFLKDVGPRPDGTSLDRIDPFGNYEPGNVRWATPEVQASNRRSHYEEKREAA